MLILSSLSLGILSVSPALADCSHAISTYNLAISDVSSRLKRYASCVSDSQGKDECSLEFGRLRSAQGDFELAVSGVQTNCQR
ncbi:hypothetical protein MOX02_60750 [Methylobacterium oxalidis]|uniref:Lysozyme inhibitor LprI N-terminal domain-containing protein n=1 Tax=Methylobacterium oxalidis TaxID=944322 RepID=A0A512JDP3_9HYPH|nr:hypothetical protein MOX02_60750 [Methylobacterium oxalidis]GLS66909.1 hypothetical protein GCM10007888_52920 [Methylobacterium oxalidis]